MFRQQPNKKNTCKNRTNTKVTQREIHAFLVHIFTSLTVLAEDSIEARRTFAQIPNKGVSPLLLTGLTDSLIVTRVWMTRPYT